ncbi:hypothetical protein MFIFM68171_05682 [Madurella fahalii]|uniref:Protein kinase domain-containing protein n=1 Tax=Madurella fahalii TaxID=1157608 RepID=A0ABQ0GCH6_9PEZI
MDTFGSVGTATSLLVQAFHLFRHVSSARHFADSAGTLAALIAVEYFRFETWLQQSGLLVTDAISREFVVSESSLRRAILLAAEMQSLNYEPIERHVLTVISQAYQCLQILQKLREKYALHDEIGPVDRLGALNSLTLRTNSEIPAANPLFLNSKVAAEVSKDINLRQRRARTVSFFRRVNFTWSLRDNTNDRDKVMAHIQTLKSCNDALRECLPPPQRQAADKLVNLKALALSASPSDLKGIGGAASTMHDQLHDQIYQAMMVKARRVDESSQRVTDTELKQIELNSAMFASGGHDAQMSPGISKRVLAHPVAVGSSTASQLPSVILEWVTFNPSLTEDDLGALKERIALLCTLLHSAGHPYFPALPLCTGFFQQTRTSFALAYQAPPFAVPSQPPRSLYSLLPRNKYSVPGEKPTTAAAGSFLPSLEQRYALAAALADGVLSLVSVDWMHKAITSRNVVLYQAEGSGHLDFSSPQLLGFGLARPDRSGERTIDLREGGPSPWRFWQHPELRAASVGEEHHRRFERRFDVFSLGVVLFEIGVWQDAHYYGSSASGAADEPGEFRRRLLHVCAREMAHRMGEAYKAAVMACLDGDEMWMASVGDGRGGDDDIDDDDNMETGEDGRHGDGNQMSLAAGFDLHVYSVLRGCCKQS